MDAKPVRKRRKKHKRNVIFDWLAYAVQRIVVSILYLFDVKANLRFACFLGREMWKHYHRGRKRAIDHLKASFLGAIPMCPRRAGINSDKF